ncbi:hypothetical protein [Mycolicibacterium sp. 624]|uniref:hypothetical protein n=1 Tax=Mycolicibacterium sp. 624 TaxID=3156314 RepID=UPI003397F067
MLIAAVLCLCAAAVVAATGVWLLARPRPGDPVRAVLRSVAPTQLAGSVMLAAGGAAALSAPAGADVLLLIVCVIGAIGTIAAGCYQAAKMVARHEASQRCCQDSPQETPQEARQESMASVTSGADGCAGSCASCTLSCS